MSTWRKLKHLLPSYRRAQERDMQEELESLAAIAEPQELGNMTRVAEEARAIWSWIWLEQLYCDVQYAFRTMRRSPGFTTTAVLSLALGIGANSAIFQVLDAVVLRSLPVRDPQHLVLLQGIHQGKSVGFSYPLFREMAARQNVAEGIFAAYDFPVETALLRDTEVLGDVRARLATGGY